MSKKLFLESNAKESLTLRGEMCCAIFTFIKETLCHSFIFVVMPEIYCWCYSKQRVNNYWLLNIWCALLLSIYILCSVYLLRNSVVAFLRSFNEYAWNSGNVLYMYGIKSRLSCYLKSFMEQILSCCFAETRSVTYVYWKHCYTCH